MTIRSRDCNPLPRRLPRPIEDQIAATVSGQAHECPDRSEPRRSDSQSPEIKVAIEQRLAREGFLEGQPAGFWGPDTRKALSDWVDAQGPIMQEDSAESAGS